MPETANASAYARQRVHNVRILPDTKDTLVAEFRAVLNDAETLVSADWQASMPEVCGLVSGSVSDTQSAVVATAVRAGESQLRCQVTTSSGRILNQYFNASVGNSEFPATGTAGLASLTLTMPGG